MTSFVPSRKMNYGNEYGGAGRSAYNSPLFPNSLKFQYGGFGQSNSSDDCSSPPTLGDYMSPVPTLSVKPTRPVPPIQSLQLASSRAKENSDETFGSYHGLLSPSNLTITRSTLPSRAFDANSVLAMSYGEIVNENGMMEKLAKDKVGCSLLQDNYPDFGSQEREQIFVILKKEPGLFEDLCKDVFGNFFMQVVIERSRNCETEQRFLCSKMLGNFYQLCSHRYSCRVVQKAFEQFSIELRCQLLGSLQRTPHLLNLVMDQNSNHVIQKIFNVCPIPAWAYILEVIVKDRNSFCEVAESKYGCRVIQLAIEMLTSDSRYSEESSRLLHRTMTIVMKNCERLASNEFANYVIQNVLMTGKLADYRDHIIDRCLLRNLLSMSQEKFASHVVEKALEFATGPRLKDMMDEIFDGYVPHPETKKDALDILLFHQYGNYVVQRMLEICCAAVRAQRGGIELSDMDTRLYWFRRLYTRIVDSSSRLERYSSGKKILEALYKLESENAAQYHYNNSCPINFTHLQLH